MKIRVERDGLADAVAWVARSLPSRPPVPVLGGVLLDAESEESLTVSGFDYEVSAQVGVPATIAESISLLGRCPPGRYRAGSMPVMTGLLVSSLLFRKALTHQDGGGQVNCTTEGPG